MAAMRLDLPDHVLVAGAAGGIGLAIVDALEAAGTRVTATDRAAAPVDRRHASWIAADVAAMEGRSTIAAGCPDGLGGLVYAAGILDAADWLDASEDEVARLLSVNLAAPFFLVRALLPRFAPGASIVLLGSIAGLRASPLTPFYAASKAGLRNLAASLAVILEPRGIRVNVVAPGLVDTPLTDGLNRTIAAGRGVSVAEVEAERSAAIPLGRAGTPAEVADACMFLLSRQSAYVTGTTLFATGGAMAGSI